MKKSGRNNEESPCNFGTSASENRIQIKLCCGSQKPRLIGLSSKENQCSKYKKKYSSKSNSKMYRTKKQGKIWTRWLIVARTPQTSCKTASTRSRNTKNKKRTWKWWKSNSRRRRAKMGTPSTREILNFSEHRAWTSLLICQMFLLLTRSNFHNKISNKAATLISSSNMARTRDQFRILEIRVQLWKS